MNLTRLLVPPVLLVLLTAPGAWSEENPEQALFEKVFGDAVRLDTAFHAEVVAATPGHRHFRDLNGDGKPEEVWFIDTDLRHPESMRPVLVRVIDEDGDLVQGQGPDLDSDLYVADWKADGTVNAVLDYTDLDQDNDVDEMGSYFYGGTHGYFEEPVIRVWWGRDSGDDNLLWYDIGYSYDQPLCQYRTHFGGEELFVSFALPLSGDRWVSFFENPFLFYDHDGDHITEEVLRISGIEYQVEAVRYSFDADNDATWDSPRDFDVSITAWAPGAEWTPEGTQRGRSNLSFSERESEVTGLRGFPAGPFLRSDIAQRFALESVFERMMMSWDEIDHNVDGQRGDDAEERWEGVIAHGIDDFPQVGGPSCGPVNKRFELVMKPTGPIETYYHPADRRVHLKHADKAWMEVDVNFDGTADMRYTYEDTDKDGILDRWNIDTNLDGTPEDTWNAPAELARSVAYRWGDIRSLVQPALEASAPELYSLVQRLIQAIEKVSGKPVEDPILALWKAGFHQPPIEDRFAEKFRASNESARFFLDVLKDRLLVQLKQVDSTESFWAEIALARARGDYAAMAAEVEGKFDLPGEVETLASWRVRMNQEHARPLVAWAQDWVPPNIGWESEQATFRVYWGQFDFFGKKKASLILPGIGPVSYHDENEWGIDALLVGKTGGSGGVTLYVNGVGYPVRSPYGEGPITFTKRLVSEDAGQVTSELLAENVGPTDAPYKVRFHCSALAGRADTPIVVSVEGGKPEDKIEIGVGLVQLPEEEVILNTQAGVLATWGYQDKAIGTIGMGILFPSGRFSRFENSAGENIVVLDGGPSRSLKYHVQCDWLRGRRFNRSPTAENWAMELGAAAARLNTMGAGPR